MVTAWQTIDDPNVGEGVSTADYGLKVLDNLQRLHELEDTPIYIPLNAATPLAAGDKGSYRVPAKFNGGSIVSVAADCTAASSAGTVTLELKKNGVSILSTKITMEQGVTDSLNAAVQAAIIANTLATKDKIQASVINEGTGVTYCGVEFTLRPAA